MKSFGLFFGTRRIVLESGAAESIIHGMLADWSFTTIRIPQELELVFGVVLAIIAAFLIRRWFIRRN